MDTTTRTWGRRIAAIALVVAAAVGLDAGRALPARPALAIHGADAAEERAIDWALHRYRVAGLHGMPSLEVYLHPTHDGCDGGLGLYFAGRIDLCTKGSSEPYARKFAVHEMAHAWTETNVPDELLVRFMRIRGIDAWNDKRLSWKERGTEQAAEIITWGLGEGEIAPLLPDAIDPAALTNLYELLTGRPPITSGAA